jgi:excisionase family DNA binding protein
LEEPECRTYSVRETAQVLGLSLGATYGAIYRGEIPALRFGQRIVVPKDVLHQLLENPSMVRQLSTPLPRR